jgi:DNA-binding response OmpR family regulator
MRILLVDDDVDLSDELKEWLVDCGHTVETAYSGPEALDHLQFCKYDLIMLDYNLPGKEGRDVCREYRLAGGAAPVVMLTGYSAKDSEESCLQAGVSEFLEKPFNLDKLEAVLNHYIPLENESINTTPKTVGQRAF